MISLPIIKDWISWGKTSGFRKILNVILLRLSYTISNIRKESSHWGMPLSISIEPTTSCNLRCPECPSGLRSFSRPTGMLEPEGFAAIIPQLKSSLWAINFYFQGEPFLNKNLTEMIKLAADAGIYTATSSNAHYFKPELARKTVESGLHRLIISIDGTSQETYEQYRIGGKIATVIEGTKEILKAKKELNSRTPHVIFQFLVVKPNEHQTDEVLTLADELGVDEVRFKTAQVYDYENGNELIPDNEKYSRYRKMPSGKWQLKNKMDNRCWRMWQGCVITWDGKIVPCCFDKDASHSLGKVTNMNTFKEVWRSESYNSFRNSVLTNRSQIDICRNCSEGTQIFA
ncbi:MAG: radical SAM/SPASM domain-containing protein [Bacteroidia bacterium]